MMHRKGLGIDCFKSHIKYLRNINFLEFQTQNLFTVNMASKELIWRL